MQGGGHELVQLGHQGLVVVVLGQGTLLAGGLDGGNGLLHLLQLGQTDTVGVQLGLLDVGVGAEGGYLAVDGLQKQLAVAQDQHQHHQDQQQGLFSLGKLAVH